MELARRAARGGSAPGRARRRAWVAFVLGLLFLLFQLALWKRLVETGVFASSDPRAAALYVLTGLHGIHVIGGLAYQVLVLYRLSPWRRLSGNRQPTPQLPKESGLGLCAAYWHFLGALWLVVLAALWAFA
jgi:cytochrome c oxidase subunit 3